MNAGDGGSLLTVMKESVGAACGCHGPRQKAEQKVVWPPRPLQAEQLQTYQLDKIVHILIKVLVLCIFFWNGLG